MTRDWQMSMMMIMVILVIMIIMVINHVDNDADANCKVTMVWWGRRSQTDGDKISATTEKAYIWYILTLTREGVGGVEGLGRNNKTIEAEQTVEYITPTTPKGWGRRGCKTATWFDKSLFALPHKTNSSLLGHFRIQMPEKDEYVVIGWTATTTWWWLSTMITKTTLEVQLCLFPLLLPCFYILAAAGWKWLCLAFKTL